MPDFKVKFLGTRGSYPVFGDKYKKFGGSTTCVAIEIENEIIILDGGTGIIEYGKKLVSDSSKKIYIFYYSYTSRPYSRTAIFCTTIFS